MTPVLASTRAELHDLLAERRRPGARVALVPTMGALHQGHLCLMRAARAEVGPDAPVVVSIFVNPLQFGPNEDLDRYPRTFDADLAACEAEGVDLVFAPSVDEVNPGGTPQVTVAPGPIAEILEGRTRPGHFAGVLTVVAKLFGLVRPDVAVFGEKDYQQLVLVRRMVADLCLGVEVVGVPTVREPDGLALSSRNRYLDPEQRLQAVGLSRTLRAAQQAAPDGLEAVVSAARGELRRSPGIDLDYLVVADPDLGDVRGDGPARVLIAGRVGTTRLIDNLPINLGGIRDSPVRFRGESGRSTPEPHRTTAAPSPGEDT
jgi:pantoate--beta-alanine ligase